MSYENESSDEKTGIGNGVVNKMNRILYLLLLLLSCVSFSQRIGGTLKDLKNTELILTGYEGFTEKELAKTTTDAKGHFTMNYPAGYVGAVLLQPKGAGGVILLLNHESFTLQWENLQDFNSLQFVNSPENLAFAQGININRESEQKLAGLSYLLPLYKDQRDQTQWLLAETGKQKLVFENYIRSLPGNSVVKNYLKLRKFLGDMQLTQEKFKELSRVRQHEEVFKNIDFANTALWHSGLLKEMLTWYYELLGNYNDAKLITAHAIEANTIWMKSLEKEPSRLQEVAEYCFTMLEQRNLTKAAEQIALAMLGKENCTLTDKQINLFEQYRKLAIGKTAPDIVLKKGTLKSLDNPYKLVVFGASWCPNCQNDYPSLLGKCKKLKEMCDLEVVYISIDTDKTAFENYYKEAPFIMYFDGKGWESNAVKDYHVFATPTYWLLSRDLKILSKPRTPEEAEQWLMSNR